MRLIYMDVPPWVRVVDSQLSGNGARNNDPNIDDHKPLTIMQIHTHCHMKTMEFHRTAAHQYNIIITPLAGYDAKTLAD